MLLKPKKFNFELILNGRYDKDGKPEVTRVCFIPKSLRVENNEKEVLTNFSKKSMNDDNDDLSVEEEDIDEEEI